MSGSENIEPIDNLGAVVLCGGKSTRLGIDKTQLIFQGRTFLERVVRQVTLGCGGPVVLVGDTDLTNHNLPSNIVIVGDEKRGKGPLEGIRVGLKQISGHVKFAFVTSCDVPLLQPGVIRFLHERIGEYDAVVPVGSGRVFGMTAIYRTSLHREIGQRIANAQLRVSDLASAFSTNQIDIEELKAIDPDLDSLTNVNLASDYFELLKRFGLECPDQLAGRMKE